MNEVDLAALSINYNKKRPVIQAVKEDLLEILSTHENSKNSNLRFLDVGCGAGQISDFILETLPDTYLLGIDITESMITQCESIQKRFGRRCNFIKQDINKSENLMKGYHGFDCFIFSQSLHFIETRTIDFLTKFNLNSNGLVIIIATLPEDLNNLPYCQLSNKVLEFEKERLLNLMQINELFHASEYELTYNKRIVLNNDFARSKGFYLSRPFSALTILEENELKKCLEENEVLITNSDIVDIFNIIVFKKN